MTGARFVIQFLKKPVHVSGWAEDIALAHIFLRLFSGILFIILIRGLAVVICHDGGDRIDSIMGDLSAVAPYHAGHMQRTSVEHGLNRGAPVDDIRHSAHLLGVSAEMDGADYSLRYLMIQNDGIRIGLQTDTELGVIIAQFDPSAYWHSFVASRQKKTATLLAGHYGRSCLYLMFQAIVDTAKGRLRPPFSRSALVYSALNILLPGYASILPAFNPPFCHLSGEH